MRVLDGELEGDRTAQGVTYQAGPIHPLRVQKGGHELPCKVEGIVVYPLIRAAEARQIQSKDPVALGKGLDIILPIVTGGSQAVDKKEWTPLA
jgi:hypothetical protein